MLLLCGNCCCAMPRAFCWEPVDAVSPGLEEFMREAMLAENCQGIRCRWSL